MRSIPLPLSGRPILGGLGGGLPDEDRAALKALVLLGGFFFVAVAAAYGLTLSWSEPIPRDATSLVVGRDYLNFWMYGRAAAAADPGRFYDPALYNEALRALLGPNYFGQNWSYPPSLMLIAAPFGRLPYLAGLFIWTALGLTTFLLVARRALSDTRVLIALVVFSGRRVLRDLRPKLAAERGDLHRDLRLPRHTAGGRGNPDRMP